MTTTSDHQHNLEAAAKLASLASDAGSCLLCLPEAFSFIGTHHSQTTAQAEPLNGPRMEGYRSLARKHGLWLSLGGFHEAGGEGGRVHNTHVLLDAEGATIAEYRKIHLFDVDVPNGPVLLESTYTAPGPAEAVVVDATEALGLKLGITTCYDLRFPELYTALARRGANVMLVPSAFTVPTGQAHWHLLLRARAVETQSFVLAAAQVGKHSEKRESFGHALAVGPWGDVLGDAGPEASPNLFTVDLDTTECDRIREKMPLQKQRRQDVLDLLSTNGTGSAL